MIVKNQLKQTLIAIFCTVAATLFACYRELKESPAALMRPKSPKAGKRVLLERIKFIWNRLSFTRKVTVRNVFRYKKRFLMTIVGIAGCTGLIIAGFGLRDGITSIVSSQYEKVFNYQIEVTFKPDVTLNEKNKEVERIKKIDKINDVLIVNKESVEIKNKNTNQSIQLIVPFSSPDGFISLKNRTSGEEYKLNNNIVVSEKLSKLLNLKKGDRVLLYTDGITEMKNRDNIEFGVDGVKNLIENKKNITLSEMEEVIIDYSWGEQEDDFAMVLVEVNK